MWSAVSLTLVCFHSASTFLLSECIDPVAIDPVTIDPGCRKETHGRIQVYSVTGGLGYVFIRLKVCYTRAVNHMIAVYKSEHCAKASWGFLCVCELRFVYMLNKFSMYNCCKHILNFGSNSYYNVVFLTLCSMYIHKKIKNKIYKYIYIYIYILLTFLF